MSIFLGDLSLSLSLSLPLSLSLSLSALFLPSLCVPLSPTRFFSLKLLRFYLPAPVILLHMYVCQTYLSLLLFVSWVRCWNVSEVCLPNFLSLAMSVSLFSSLSLFLRIGLSSSLLSLSLRLQEG